MASDKARSAITEPVASSRARRSRHTGSSAARATEPADGDDREGAAPPPSPASETGNGADAAAAEARRTTRRARKTKDGLPEGWVIDEEGYVVPRHG